jgi:hypothetical protein
VELLSTIIVVWIGLICVLAIQRRRWTSRERRMIWAAFGVHLAGGLAQLGVTLAVYSGGDSIGYFRRAGRYADLIRDAPFIWGPRVLAHTFQVDIGWPLSGFAGTTSGSMTGLTVLPVLVTGKSILATFLCFALLAFFGKLLCYRAVRVSVPPEYRDRMCMAFLFLPSVVFWTSGILKESVATAGLGLAVYGLAHLVYRHRVWRAAAMIAVGALFIGFVKPYILFPLSAAGGVWYFWQNGGSRRQKLKPVHFVIGAVLAIGGVIALGQLFPQYAYDNIGLEAARLQEIGTLVTGGSSYEIVDSTDRTLAGQLAYAPLALATSLFRPLPFEIVNITSAVNAIEVFFFTLLFIRAWLAHGWRGLLRRLRGLPFMAFAFTFTLVAGVAIGLATTNLGTLSRYRVPMFPFYVAMIAYAFPLKERAKKAVRSVARRGHAAGS